MSFSTIKNNVRVFENKSYPFFCQKSQDSISHTSRSLFFSCPRRSRLVRLGSVVARFH
jgi:hypothetical protein